jgi:hypothetical protein
MDALWQGQCAHPSLFGCRPQHKTGESKHAGAS